MIIMAINLFVLVLADWVFAVHILEPLGTESAATPPRARMFGQAIYDFSREKNTTKKNTHLLPVEFEIGLRERTQLNLEGEILLRQEETSATRKSGVEEIELG